MSVELDEVSGFLAQHEPFSRLPAAALAQVTAAMAMEYVRRGSRIVTLGERNDRLHVIRTGAVDVIGEEGILLDRREAGRTFGYSTLVGEPESRYSMVAVEDTLLLVLSREAFGELVRAHPDIDRFYSSLSLRISRAAAELRSDPTQDVLATGVRQMMGDRGAVQTDVATSIRDAAVAMMDGHVSSLLITSGGELAGILTDKDLRARVVAGGVDPSRPVAEVMTADPTTIVPEALAFEAMLLMSELGIHHLPVVEDGRILGVVSSGDLSRLLKANPIFLTADLSRRGVDELEGAYRRAAETVIRLGDRGAGARESAQVLTTVGDALVRRLISLFEESAGPAPVDYAFVAVGSQGRREMGPASDQDNALILSDDYDEATHGNYFERLSTFVCTGLDRAGQVLCPGNMMAMNPDWRVTRSEWMDTFHRWITAPQPDALLNAQIYFDMRVVAGNAELAEEVHAFAVDLAAGAPRLHAHLAALAARREPPLGFFRGFVLEKNGEYADTLDVKKGGTAALVQMARLYAIKAGVTAVGTRERFEHSAGKSLSPEGAENLLDAFDFLSALTHRYQAQQLRSGNEPDYHVDPAQLSTSNRENLRDAFQIIKKMQAALSTAHPVRSI